MNYNEYKRGDNNYPAPKENTGLFCLLIIAANFLAQGYLLMLNGTFWDDWLYYYHDIYRLWNQYLPSGRPSLVIIPAIFWNLPNDGYRWTVFLSFLVCSLLYYYILEKLGLFDRTDNLLVALLFTTIPVNDARVCIVDLPFTLSLCSFFVGSAFLIKENFIKVDHFPIQKRILILVCFVISFLTNSFLVFYILPLGYVFYHRVLNKGSLEISFKNILKSIWGIGDFILLPVLFFAIKNTFFPTYGLYEHYNEVNFSKIKWAVKHILQASKYSIKNVVGYMFLTQNIALLALWVGLCLTAITMVVTCFHIDIRKIKMGCICKTKLIDLIYIIASFFILCLGLFPYVVVRENAQIEYIGVAGRDSLLLPVGLALFIVCVLKMFLSNNIIRSCFISALILLGTIACNKNYLNYQIDAYWQKTLISKLKTIDQIKNADNILFLTDNILETGSTRFYSLNGDASVAYGNQSRLFLNGYDDLWLLNGSKAEELAKMNYLINDYNPKCKKVDIVIKYNCDYTYKDCLKLRVLELTDHKRFNQIIYDRGEISCFPVESLKAKELLKGYEKYY